jgi:ABC-type proline/glycine betaine transport system ATPase subunit
MKGGRVLAHGTARELMSQPADPAVAALLAMPHRQAERVRAALSGNGIEHADA